MRIQARSLVSVLAFVVVTGLLIALTGITFGHVRFERTVTYHAIFGDASGIKRGSDVRAAGVSVGSVGKVQLTDDDHVEVTFSVPRDLALTSATHAQIRYANLTGDRYLDLTPGDTRRASRLPSGGTIQLAETRPALDLDQLFKGFDPLLQALNPNDVNQLTANILAVTQGQAGSIQALLQNVGDFTTNLARSDTLIGQVITNLNGALGTVDRDKTQVVQLIDGLQGLTRGLARDRRTIGRSLVGTNQVAQDVSTLLAKTRPGLKANIDQVGTVATKLNGVSQLLEEVLNLYPSTIQRLGRGGAYGSFFNFFLCSVQVHVEVPGLQPIATQRFTSGQQRCTDPKVAQ